MSAEAGGRWLPAGTRLNDVYQLERGIAAGGMGEVYSGHNIHTGDIVAIKMIRTDVADTDSAMLMFRKEASALHNLYHEAIVRYYTFSVDPALQRPYMVMEFVSGRSLKDIIKVGPMEYDDVRTLGARVAAGLQTAHERGIIHRDISPDNIIVPNDDVSQAKIIDFGIARQTKASEGTIIGDGFAGKYNYVSPEQLGLFGGDVTAASDIYSLGLVLAEATAGRSLNMRGNPVEVVEKRRVVPNLDHIEAALQPILAWMLQPDPADRPGSMTEVAAWLKRRNTAVPGHYDDQDDGGRTRLAPTMLAPDRNPGSQWTSPRSRGTEHGSRVPEGRQASYPPEPRRGSSPPQTRSTPPNMSAFPRTGYPQREAPSAEDRGDTVFLDLRRSGQHTPSQPPNSASRTPVFDPANMSRRPTVQPYGAVAQEPARKKGSNIAVLAMVAAILLTGAAGGVYYFLRPVLKSADGPQVADKDANTPTKPNTNPVDDKPKVDEKPQVADVSPPTGERLRGPDIAKFVTAYDGGDCLYLAPIETSETDAAIEGYASSSAPIDRFKAKFQSATGFEPDVRLRQVTDAQCSFIKLFGATRAEGADRPRLELVNASVRAGDLIAGEALPPKGRFGAVLLIRTDGSVSVLARSDGQDDGALSFISPADVPPGTVGSADLVAVVTSPRALDALAFTGTMPGADLAAKLEAEMRNGGLKLASTAQYLALDR